MGVQLGELVFYHSSRLKKEIPAGPLRAPAEASQAGNGRGSAPALSGAAMRHLTAAP